MALSYTTVFFGMVALATANHNISSPPITNWGDWGRFERCNFGSYVQGFQLKTEPNQYLLDDTALNAIRLFCGDPFRPQTQVITSTEGEFGVWGDIFTCYPGVLTGFRLRVEPNRNSGDDTATNNVRFYCTEKPNDYIEGDGMFYGDWTDSRQCYGGQALCGIQTQVEPNQWDGDDTSLNNVLMECCDYAAHELEEGRKHVEEFGRYPESVSPKFADFIRSAMAMKLQDKSSHTQVKAAPVGKVIAAMNQKPKTH